MSAFAQVEVYEVLVWYSRFPGQCLEVLDHICSQAYRDLLTKVLGIGIAHGVSEVVFSSHR